MDIWIEFLRLSGGFCLLYFVFIMLYVGFRPSFHYVWFAAGMFLRLLQWSMENGVWHQLPEAVRLFLIVFVIFLLFLFLLMESKVFSKMWAVPAEPVKYVIVLGACVRGTRVTRSLSYRLKKAAVYAKKYPECILVVSGGQGPGENITEAEAMSGYLQKLGISPERILLEDRSVNTRENLVFSRRIILQYEEKNHEDLAGQGGIEGSRFYEEAQIPVAVCSNNFHIYRAVALAKAVGTWKVYGLAAMTDPFMWLSFTVREGAALFKELMFGHISWK